MSQPLIERFLLAGILVAGLSASACAQERQQSPAGQLPAGEAIVAGYCAGACHGADHFVNEHRTAEAWRKTVLQMVSNGAQLSPEDIESVTSYLSTYMGTATGAAAAAGATK